jgi:hypothetical protein
MTDLSPAVQAIVKAFDDRYELLGPLEDDWQEQCLAAAIRELADQVVPPWDAPSWDYELVMGTWQESNCIRRELLAIATELEGHA